MPSRYAVDTNVLLRLARRDHPDYELIATALRRLVARDVELCFTPQNLGEFWNASTRPIERNGFGLSIGETSDHIGSIERRMTLLHEDSSLYAAWRRLLIAHEVRGVQVHDAHLAAVLDGAWGDLSADLQCRGLQAVYLRDGGASPRRSGLILGIPHTIRSLCRVP